MAKEMIAMLLAGGQGSRLYALTQKLAKPAVSPSCSKDSLNSITMTSTKYQAPANFPGAAASLIYSVPMPKNPPASNFSATRSTP